MFDHVVVAVIGNPDKSSGMFSVADRVALIRSAARTLSNVTCVNHHGLTVDAVKQTGSDVIIRTGHKDKGDEWSMLAMNELMALAMNELMAGTRTCFVPPDPEVAFLSSSLVRSLTSLGRVDDAIRFVPPPVAQALQGRS